MQTLTNKLMKFVVKICMLTQPKDTVLLCDHCNRGWHMQCLGLEEIPEFESYCPQCVREIEENLKRFENVDLAEDKELF